ncbi:glycine zipper family protein [Epibacterium sp. SM1969]|uniref:Glycine zipper family protein n=1 Tax=Tritonibacter aquimaris TaxID=2663379 RepID=A0A844ASG4_9RHOB|nr:glycine zipper family protein [Tritonibacter aquimaris]MQY41324.1 glycine zipper family protein [Tritonibacter aquimaris]
MKHVNILPLLLAVAACGERGASYRPILDGPANAAYHSDLAECQRLAHEHKNTGGSAANAALVGAGVGAVLGELDDDSDALGGAIVGAVAGGAAGAVETTERSQSIVIECMRGRGHRVVG